MAASRELLSTKGFEVDERGVYTLTFMHAFNITAQNELIICLGRTQSHRLNVLIGTDCEHISKIRIFDAVVLSLNEKDQVCTFNRTSSI